MNSCYQAVLRAPFGMLGIRVTDGWLTGIDFLPAATAPRPPADPATARIHACITAYLAHGLSPLNLPVAYNGTPFQRKVWHAIQAIPAGSTITYGTLAAQLGSGARAIANACGANPLPLVIPCHRVVGRHNPGGFMRGRTSQALEIKRWLLHHECHSSSPA